MPWTKCLPIASLKVKTAPRKDLGVSPYKMLFEFPYLGEKGKLPKFEISDPFL